jgi:diguanylate cyclase
VQPTPTPFDPHETNAWLGFLERTSDLVGILDDEGHVMFLNEVARKRLGIGVRTGLTSADMFPPEAFVLYYEEVRPALLQHHTWQGELGVLTASGTAVPMDVTAVADIGPGGEMRMLIAFGREIGEPSTPEAGSEAFEAVTGLPGRATLDERLRVALALGARGASEEVRVAVIFAGLEGMENVEHASGDAVHDEVLQRIAGAMSKMTRPRDTVAQVGRHEFAVLLEGLDDTDSASEVIERVRDAVGQALTQPGEHAFGVTARFGLALANANDTPADLLARAESAMARTRSFDGSMVVRSDAHAGIIVMALADELALAVSHGQIHSYVQPVVNLQTGVTVGYQGLARWQHPVHGILDADEFVHLVASTPLLPVIDLGVLRRTAAAAFRSTRNGRAIRVYGHLSRRLLTDADVERYLVEIIDDGGVSPSDVRVEIAHETVTRPSRTVERGLRTLHKIGVGLVLTGVDGEFDVNQIVDLQFDLLRLAPRLVRAAAADPARRRVARGAIALACALGLTVIAVGIETEAERLQMLDAGCEYGEGNLFGPVRPAETFE